MAGDGDEDNDYYESDPEEAKMSLKMRRREASDDEAAEEAVDDVTHHRHTPPRADVIASDVDSDGQGGAAEYDDDEEEEAVDDVTHHQHTPPGADVIASGVDSDGQGGATEYDDEEGGEEDGEECCEDEREEEVEVKVFEERAVDELGEGEGTTEGEKKENEPFAVPTLGAFYMHDDRFCDNAVARPRKTFGGRRLWESKDDRKWGHDKFEEMNMQERHYEEGRRSSTGYYRGHGKDRGGGCGNVMGNRMRGYDSNNNQNLAPKDVRGRRPRRYQPSMKRNSVTLAPQNRRPDKSSVKTTHAGFGRDAASSARNNAEDETAPATKVASNLNYASPPFYPSGSSTLAQKNDVSAGSHNKNPRFTVVEQNFSAPLSNTMFQGKNVTDSIGMDKLRIDDSVSARAQDQGVAFLGSTMLQPPQSHSRVNKVSPPASQAPLQNAAQNQAQASLQAPDQRPGHRSIGAAQGCPPIGGKGTVEGAGMGSPMYSGAQVMGSGGNMIAGNGDQNLPAFFPVMQLGAQHNGGVRVPAVGMAFPGYVAQPNGAGNSEMTWLPVLASAGGALGATYCPPCLPIDGSCCSRPTEQTAALPVPSKDINHSRPNNEIKPWQRSEVSNDEFSQRQNKPRRYSEMNITQ